VDRGGEDLGSRVDADHAEVATAPPGTFDEGEGNVGTAGSNVEERQLVAMRRERLDRPRAEAHATEPAIDPAEIAQVAGQRGRVVKRSVEQLGGVGAAFHEVRAGYTSPMVLKGGA